MSGNQGDQSLYDTLPDPQHCLRLLEIHPARTGTDIIQCRLSTWRLDMAPSYHAISYTWGDSTSIAFVKVNGIDIKVRQNCLYVLHQVERNKYSQYYWIDTLCINQANNHEKDIQVSMMGDIYRTSENVLVCVGRHEGYSELLFKTLNKQNDLFVRASQKVPNLDELYWDVALDTQTRQALRKWKLSQRYRTAKWLIRAFHIFEARPYFKRVWTLQERFLAKSITVCCGHSHCPGGALRGLGIAMILEDRDTWMGRIISRLPAHLQYDLRPLLARRILPWQKEIEQRGRYFDRRRGRHKTDCPAYSIFPFHVMVPFRDGSFLNLWRVMMDASQLKCHDPRDKLYGIISAVDWSGLEKPKPDYACDVFDLALETLRLLALCRQEQQASWRPSQESEADEPKTETVLQGPGYAIDVAEFVLKYFDLSTQSSTKFTASIEKRSKGISAELETVDSTLVRYIDLQWWSGCELMLDTNDFEWPRARYNAAFNSSEGSASGIREATLPEKFKYVDGVLTDAHGRLRGILPSSTRSGDWLVDADRRSLVIRGRPDGRYDLIGQAIGSRMLTAVLGSDFETSGGFYMAFHVEDLLALAQNYERGAPGRVSSDHVLGSRVISHQEIMYLSPGLSYAERIAPPLWSIMNGLKSP